MKQHSLPTSGITADSCESIDLDLTNVVDETQAALLCQLVDGLAATRNEEALRSTIDSWRTRVDAAGYDSGELLDLFERARRVPHRRWSDSHRWANADKREFILVCIDVYSRGRAA